MMIGGANDVGVLRQSCVRGGARQRGTPHLQAENVGGHCPGKGIPP